MKAKIAAIDEYPWSSYLTYLNIPIWKADHVQARSYASPICDPSIMIQMFSSVKSFIEYHKKTDLPSEMALEYQENYSAPSDREVKDVICYYLRCNDPSNIQSVDKERCSKIVNNLKKIGVKTSQICRVTGLSRNYVSHVR